jgi:hypothetical protein
MRSSGPPPTTAGAAPGIGQLGGLFDVPCPLLGRLGQRAGGGGALGGIRVVSSATRRMKVAIGESTPDSSRKTSICCAMPAIGTSFTSARYLSHCLM